MGSTGSRNASYYYQSNKTFMEKLEALGAFTEKIKVDRFSVS